MLTVSSASTVAAQKQLASLLITSCQEAIGCPNVVFALGQFWISLQEPFHQDFHSQIK